MLGFIKISPTDDSLARRKEPPKERLSLAACEAVTFAVILALLALGFAIRYWTFFPHGAAS
jgi:hypothetical protein